MRFPPNQLLLYKLFLSYPERSFYMQEIGRILGKKPGVFQRTLYNLETDGFVQSEFKANARFFFLNKNYSVLKEIQSIIRKTNAEMNVFKETIKELDARHKKSKRKREPLRPSKNSDKKEPQRASRNRNNSGKAVSGKTVPKKDKDSQLELF